MIKFNGILDNKKFLFFLYSILIILSCFGFESKFYIPFYLAFAFFIGWLYFFGEEDNREFKLSRWLIVIPLLIILIVRIIPFWHSDNPLGYDTGIYKKTIEDFAKALPDLPHFSKGSLGNSEPWGLYLNTDLLSTIGLSSNQILYGYYILLNLLLALSIYALVKKFFNQNAAILAVFIFAISLTQFQTYWMMYYKNIAALFLMLMAFYLLAQKSWLAIPVGGFLGGLHPATFLVFGLAFFAHSIFNKDKTYHLIAGIGILIITFSLYLCNSQALLQFFSPDLSEMIQIFGPGAGGGTFFNFNFYRQIITFYLPFAVLGLIYLIKNKKFNYLFFYFIFNFAIVYFNLIFHNRFIIHLDIIIIILAGVGSSYLLTKFVHTLAGKITIFLLFGGALYFLGSAVIHQQPLISNEELTEIKSLAKIVKEDEYVMATDSYYSPWLYGYSERKTIAPGLFEYNKWNRSDWNAFWYTSDIELRHTLLDEYEKPIYLFVGDKEPKLDFSGDPKFTRISPRIWKYE